MQSNKENCQKCKQGCCRFPESDFRFAPIFSANEVNRIKSKGFAIDCAEFNGSKNVFQIRLAESKKGMPYSVCPFLDEETSLCKIYSLRPIDCRLWPVVLMRGKDGKEVLFACFGKENCELTEKMSDAEFNSFIENIISSERQSIAESLKKFPGLVWGFEPELSIVSKQDLPE